MTREEAIKQLNAWAMRGDTLPVVAIHMAIEALQAKTDGDLISRHDALKPFCIAPDGTRIPEVDCDNFPVEFSVEFIKKHLLSLPSADITETEKCQKCQETTERVLLNKASAEAKGDLISRHWLLDLYATPEDGDDVEWKVPLEVVRQNILDAPSADTDMSEYCDRLWKIAYERGKAEAVQGWIPCSERLPSEDRQYLVFYEGTIIGSWIEIMWYGEPSMPNVDVSGKHFYRSDDEWGDIIYDEVIAWMPLPEPYKGGEADEID